MYVDICYGTSLTWLDCGVDVVVGEMGGCRSRGRAVWGPGADHAGIRTSIDSLQLDKDTD